MRFGSVITIIVLAMGYMVYSGVEENKVYYKTIKELRSMGDAAHTKKLRVAGNVQPGSIHQSGTHADFVLVEEDQTLPVSYKGSDPPPDTFKDNSQAVATGEFGKDGVFHATELTAKCASKYAAQQPGSTAPAPKAN